MGRPITIDSRRGIAGAVHVRAIRTVTSGTESATKRGAFPRGQAPCQRARLLHSALVSQYVSITVLAFSSLLGTLADRWFATLKWLPEMMTFLGVAVISYAAIQLIRESKLLITVILDEVEGESTTQ